MTLSSIETIRPEPGYQGQLKLVTHADHALGKHVAARLLCNGETVRAHVSARHPAHTQRLRRAGADVIDSDLYAPNKSVNLWHGVGSVVHAAASGASWGKEAVVSVSDLGGKSLIQAAEEAKVRDLVLLHPPTQEIRSRLARSTLPYTLLCPDVADSGTPEEGVSGPYTRQIVLMPLLRVADALVFAASGGFEGMTLGLPTVPRCHGDVVDQVERLLRLPEAPVADTLLAELIVGSPYKLITPGVARALGLTFPKRYLERVFSPPED